MACPHVSGIAALMISANPNLTASEVQNIIKRSCRKLDKYSFSNSTDHPDGTWNNEVGYGLVNAHKAVVMAAAKNIQIEGSPFIESGATATFSLSSPELLKSVAWSVEGKYLRSKIASQSTDPSQAVSITTVAGEPYANTLRAKVVDIMGNSFSITREIYPNTRKNNNTFVGRLIQESCSQNGTTYPKLNKALSGPTEYLYKYCSAEIGFAKEYLLGWRCDGSVSVTPSYWRYDPGICRLYVTPGGASGPYQFRFSSEQGTKTFTLFTWSDNSVHSLNLQTDASTLYVGLESGNGLPADATGIDIEVIDMQTGQSVGSATAVREYNFNTSSWRKGYYVVRATFDGNILENKIIIK